MLSFREGRYLKRQITNVTGAFSVGKTTTKTAVHLVFFSRFHWGVVEVGAMLGFEGHEAGVNCELRSYQTLTHRAPSRNDG